MYTKWIISHNTVLLDVIKKELQNLDSNKATQIFDIPTKIIKENIDIISSVLYVSVRDSICQSNFKHNFKFADLTPVYKKESRNNKTNYHPVSILPNTSKQISQFLENILSKYQTGFQKEFSARNCLVTMRKQNEYAALLTDLWKVFDCLPSLNKIHTLKNLGVRIET